MDEECALYFHHKLIGNKIGGGKIISLTTATFVSLTFICVWSRLSHQCPWGLTLRSTPDPRGNDLISVQHKETQMTAFSMPCFCATEGINYKNAFNRSAKSGVLHCLGRSPILRRSRSIPPSLLPAVISSSSEIPLLFGIGFTWLIQTVNRLPLQKQKKTEEYTVKLPGWIRGLWATAHCQNVIKPQWEKMSSLRGAREGENNGVRREGGCGKGVRSSALFTASCESLSPIACLDPVCLRLWSAIRFSEPVAEDGKCWHNSLLRCFIFVSTAASVALSNSTLEKEHLLTVCFSWNINCHFSCQCPIIPVKSFRYSRGKEKAAPATLSECSGTELYKAEMIYKCVYTTI